jgi:hypothetical protein
VPAYSQVESPPFIWVLIYGTHEWSRKETFFPKKDGSMPLSLERAIQWIDEAKHHQSTREYRLIKYYLPDTLRGPRLFED